MPEKSFFPKSSATTRRLISKARDPGPVVFKGGRADRGERERVRDSGGTRGHSGMRGEPLGACGQTSWSAENVEGRFLSNPGEPSSPGSGRFPFFGRRKKIHPRDDRGKRAHSHHYGSTLFFFIILIVGLNVLDTLFTMMILDKKGSEFNPVVRAVMDIHGDLFWIWKFVMVSVCLVFLCLLSKRKPVRVVITLLTSIYLMTVIYQILLLSSR